MTNQTVTVPPGGATLLNSNLAPGTTIYNQDAKNAVWISSHPDTAPGYGIPVQPLGTASWAGGMIYAVVDAGVTSNVTLSMSSDVSATDNPVAVGAAVATQLLSQGIPSVMLGKVLYSGLPLPTGLLPGGGYSYTIPGIDFTKYASVIVILTNTNPYQVRCDFNDTATGAQFIGKSLHSQRGYGSVTTFAVNVTAGNMSLFISSLSINNITIFATNRQLISEGLCGADLSYINAIPSQAWGAGQTMPFGFFNSKGGTYTVRLSSAVAPATCKGYFGYLYQGFDGTNNTIQLLDTATALTGVTGGTELRGQINLPPGNIALQWLNDPSTPHTYDIKLSLTAGSSY